MPAFDLAQVCSSQTLILAFSAKDPAGKRKAPNLTDQAGQRSVQKETDLHPPKWQKTELAYQVLWP